MALNGVIAVLSLFLGGLIQEIFGIFVGKSPQSRGFIYHQTWGILSRRDVDTMWMSWDTHWKFTNLQSIL